MIFAMDKVKVAIFLAVALVFSVLPVSGFAVGNSDIEGHWGEEVISVWLQEGWSRAYPDGTFWPDRPVTRAEFVAFVNRAYHTPPAATGAPFSDISGTAWYYLDVSRAAGAGIVSGYPGGTFGPEATLSRQEAAVILTRLLTLDSTGTMTYTDRDHIAVWAEDAVGAALEAGLMSGYPDGTFGPQRPITRAETVVILNRGLALAPYITVFDQPGTYGPEVGFEEINNDVIITADEVTLQNLVIAGSLTITEEVGDGSVILNNLTVLGETHISGGGADSIYINGGEYSSITVYRSHGTLRVAVFTEDGVSIVVAEIATDSEIILQGNFESVVVMGDQVTLVTQDETTIDELYVSPEADDAKIVTSDATVIKSLVVDSEGVILEGKGEVHAVRGLEADSLIDEAGLVKEPEPVEEPFPPPLPIVSMASISDASLTVGETQEVIVDTNATSIVASSGDESVVAVEVENSAVSLQGLAEGTAKITITGFRSGYQSFTRSFWAVVTVPVTGVTIEQADQSLDIGDSVQLSASIQPADATNKDVTWASDDTGVASIDANGLLTAVTSGVANITVTTVDGGYTDSVEATVYSHDASLSDLQVNGDTVAGFDPYTLLYEVELPFGTTLIPTVSATANHAGATVVITQATELPGSAMVVVTAEDGTTEWIYTLTFTVAPPSDDASLSDLQVDGNTVAGFDPTTLLYEVELPFRTTLIPTVSATANHAGATVVITQATELPGSATLVVTAEDGTTEWTYTVSFTVGGEQIYTIPFVEDFSQFTEDQTFPEDWERTHAEHNYWLVRTTSPWQPISSLPEMHFSGRNPHMYQGLSRIISPEIDASGAGTLTLTFIHQLRVQGSHQVTNPDSTLLVQVSIDGGTTWITVWSHAVQYSWLGVPITTENVNLDMFAGQSFIISWAFQGNFASYYDRWIIDDIAIQ